MIHLTPAMLSQLRFYSKHARGGVLHVGDEGAGRIRVEFADAEGGSDHVRSIAADGSVRRENGVLALAAETATQ